MALVLAVLALVFLSLAVAGIMLSLNSETKITGHGVRRSQAFYIAEAGVAEAQARIRAGDVPNNGNPRMVSQIFLTAAGTVPVLGADSVALATQQPAGSWLPYSTNVRSDRVLTVSYKTNPARTAIYRYDPTKPRPIQTATGLPIYTITSVGQKSADKATIVTEVMLRPFNLNTKGAVTAEVGINFSGNSDVCGWNHSADTPAGTKGRPPCSNYELASGQLPGAWSCGTISTGGSATQNGNPPRSSGQTGFYTGPWQCVGMSQQEFYDWVGSPISAEPDPPRGILYLDHDTTPQNRTGSFAYHGGNGEGLLYVDGDLTINGNFNYVGLIYVEGDLKINGTCWILGGLVVKGIATIKIANGNCCVLYSYDAIQQKLTKYGGEIATLSWRENL